MSDPRAIHPSRLLSLSRAELRDALWCLCTDTPLAEIAASTLRNPRASADSALILADALTEYASSPYYTPGPGVARLATLLTDLAPYLRGGRLPQSRTPDDAP